MWRISLAAVPGRSLMLSTCAALVLGACQGVIDPAGPPANPPEPLDAGERPDAGPTTDAGPAPDAREGIDAAPGDPGLIALTQSNNPTLVDPGTSLACNDPSGFVAPNHYFRVFVLPDLGIDTDFQVTKVQFGVRQATSLVGVQTVAVNLYTLEGALAFANLSDPAIAQELVELPDQVLTLVDVPFAGAVIPAGSTLAVEVFVPDGVADGNELLVGFNGDGQTGPSFIAAPTCGFAEPVEISEANMLFDIHLVMTVSGRAL
jgi:hypothetical protein